MKRTIFLFTFLILCILILFQISKFAFLKGDLNIEIGISIIAVVFFSIGLIINKRSEKNKSVDTKKNVNFIKIKELNISNREYDVLLALNENLTNKEVARKLFISENTVKKHVSKLFAKLSVSKRAEVVEKAEKLGII